VQILKKLSAMASGECCWIERKDIHVYCSNPMVERMMPWGRLGWHRDPEAVRFAVVCPAGGTVGQRWTTATEAAALVELFASGEVLSS